MRQFKSRPSPSVLAGRVLPSGRGSGGRAWDPPSPPRAHAHTHGLINTPGRHGRPAAPVRRGLKGRASPPGKG